MNEQAHLNAQALAAHRHSSRHRDEVAQSEVCGCFYCLRTFKPKEIVDWLRESGAATGEAGYTARCPHCGIDSVIGSASEYPITPEFLGAMHRRWFSPL